MKKKSLYLLTYDISENKIRTKAAKLILKYGVRVQYSCFEIRCSEKEFKELIEKINEIIDMEIDSIFVFPITKNMEKSIIYKGSKPKTKEVL